MKIKICGITNLEDAMLCSGLAADAIGFIFYKKSKRYVLPKVASEIIKQLPPFIIKVGVFVNENPNVINDISKKIKLNLIQLHGEESAENIDIIELPVIKAFRVNQEFNYSKLYDYQNCSFLLDAYDEKEYGGTGKQFAWEKIPKNLRSKIILAGGITKEDLKIIKDKIKPYAIDVSSSLEIKPGKKDKQKVELFLKEFNK